MISRILTTLIFCTLYTLSFSQSTRFVNDFSPDNSSIFGPISANNLDSTVSMFAYIFPSQTLGNFDHGDSIRSLEFNMASTGNGVTKANMKIYIASTAKTDFGVNNIHWVDELAAMNAVKVYDKNPATDLGTNPGFKVLNFNSDVYVHDTTGGKFQLVVFVEYFQETASSGTISWNIETGTTFVGYTANQTKFYTGKYPFPDSTNSSTANHPEMIINFPRMGNDLTVQNIYCLGKIPVNTAADEVIKARIKNIGAYTSTMSSKVILNITGLNAFTDTVIIPGLPSFKDTVVAFKSVSPNKITTDNIEIKVTPDDNTVNDVSTIDRLVTANIFNHADPNAGASGGVGFSGATGDFVAKFETDISSSINQVKVRFISAGRSFQLGIWDDNNGVPGNNIYTSDTLITNDSVYIVKVDPKVTVNGVFYVGIRQTGTINVAFGFQYEIPVRSDAFFFTGPIGNTNWTPFSPGFDFKLMIEPRLQVGHDVAVEKILPPFGGGKVKYSLTDSIKPEGLLANYGSITQTTPFNIICDIKLNGNPYYRDTIQDTIKADFVKQIQFNKAFYPNTIGSYTCEMYTDLDLDIVTDNDLVTSNFEVAIENDVSADAIFTPTLNDTFESKRDSFQPILRLKNWGSVNQSGGFDIVFQVVAGNKIVYEEVKTETIGPNTTKIIVMDSLVIDTFGKLTMRAFTRLTGDERPLNDTIYGQVIIKKSKDIALVKILHPKNDSVFVRTSVGFRPQVNISNVGEAFQDSGYAHFQIFRGSKKVYATSSLQPINILSTRSIVFNDQFIPDTTGFYEVLAFTSLKGDQDNRNDTMRSQFWIKVGTDVEATAILLPVPNKQINSTFTPFKPQVRITNKGLLDADSFDITMVITKASTIVYQSTVRDSIPKDVFHDVEFNDLFSTNDLGNYKVTLYTALSGDELLYNDTIESQFVISRFYDVGVRKIISPVSQSNLPFENPITLTVEVKNYGADTGNITFDLHFLIERGTASMYNESVSVTLDSGETRNVSMPLNFSPTFSGPHIMYTFTSLSTDQQLINDSLVGSFTIDEKIGVENINADKNIIAYPNPFNNTIVLKSLNSEQGLVKVQLTNSLGATINTWQNVDLNQPFEITNLSKLPAGFYFITLQTETGIYRFKLTKQN